MAAIPWFLLAAGIVFVIVGILIAWMSRPSGPHIIDHRMRDEDIARSLQGQRNLLPSIVMVVGFVLILVSIVWRVTRWFH